MIDLSLLGGWAAGGPATDPGVPAVDFAPATGVPDETGVVALDAAFRNLIDALAPAVEPSKPGAAAEVTPVFWPAWPEAGQAVLSGAERPEHPHAAVSGEQETHVVPESASDDPAVITIVAGLEPAPIVAAQAPAASRDSTSTLIGDPPAEDADARTNQKAIPAYQAQVHRAAIAAGVRDVMAAPQAQPAPMEPSEAPPEKNETTKETTHETTASVARPHVPGTSAAIPAAAAEFDPNPQRDRSEARRSVFTFSKPLGHDVRVAAESIAAAKPGSVPQGVLTFTLPVPATLTASAATVAAPVTFSPGPQASQETADQIVQAIRLTWARGGGEAHIRLDPRQFGDLSIALRVDHGEVVARLQAETSEVRDWLRANQHLLREGLAQHDLRLDRLEIAASAEERPDARDADDERQDGRRDDGGRPAPRKARARETSAIFEIVA